MALNPDHLREGAGISLLFVAAMLILTNPWLESKPRAVTALCSAAIAAFILIGLRP